jgi:hypothetical protein
LGAAFSRAKDRYTSGAKPYSPLEAEFRRIVVELETAAMEAVYAENERGGEARSVVAEAAGALGVDLNDSFDARWDRDSMARVVPAAAALKKERDDALAARDAWKELAERADERLAPATAELRRVKRELRDARAKTHHVEADLALATRTVRDLRAARVPGDGSGGRFSITLPATDSPKAYVAISGGDGTSPQRWAGVSQEEVEELKATVVRQANEITALKGESA